jgi:hypothetical protein
LCPLNSPVPVFTWYKIIVRISFWVSVGGYWVSFRVVSICLKTSPVLVIYSMLLFSGFYIAGMALYIPEIVQVAAAQSRVQ